MLRSLCATGMTVYVCLALSGNWSSIGHAAGPALSDAFKGTQLDQTNWRVLRNDGLIETGTGRPPGLLLSGLDHKRIASVQSFSAGTSAMAQMTLDGDYQKFGFQVNAGEDRDASDAGAYFDTLEPAAGGAVDVVHAIVWDGNSGGPINPASGLPYPLCDVAIPAAWGEMNIYKVTWRTNSVEFWVNGQSRAVCPVALPGMPAKPVGIWNDRGNPMAVNWVIVHP